MNGPLAGMHIILAGFTQTYDRPNGSEVICRDMISVVPSGHGVFFFLWDVDTEGLAHFINRMTAPESRVCFYCYSWGGDTAVDCCWQLNDMGQQVSAMVCCDAVNRTPWLPKWLPFNPLSMTRFPKITVPPNVYELWQFRQTNNHPRGHIIKKEKGHELPVIHEPVFLNRTHEWMDDAPEYRQQALAVAAVDS